MTTEVNEERPADVLDIDGLSTSVRRHGAGAPLLYLSGQGYSGRWLSLYEDLSEDFDVIVPDHPGFGATALPHDVRDFNDLGVHYASLLDALSVGRVHLVGHAFGGWVAAEFAGMYPERVASLTLIAPSGLLPDAAEPMPDPYRMGPEQWLAEALGGTPDTDSSTSSFEGDWVEGMIADYSERMGVARVAWNPRYSFRLEHRLQRVRSLSQVLVPQEDRLTAPSVARRYTEKLPGAESLVIVGAASPTQHLVVLQEPAQIAARIRSLVARADTSAP